MSMILVNSGGVEALPEWQCHFRRFLPDFTVGYLDDPKIDPGKVSYVLVYSPPPGRLAQFPNLRLIISAGAGVDHITRDKQYPAHLPIVRMSSGETAQRMSEYVALACLCILREVPRIVRGQRERHWDHFETTRSATDTRAGVMGLGNLGTKASLALKALGFAVSGWSRTLKSIEGVDCFSGREELGSFLTNLNILVCLLPGTDETNDMINRHTIALLPRGASIVNVARSSCVNRIDLVDALDSDYLSQAVLDVFDEEPLPQDDALWAHPKVMVTPHIAALSTRLDRTKYAADVIRRFEQGEQLPNEYDPVRGY
jgi:glyoxylate/hydroxypyruvate reductase